MGQGNKRPVIIGVGQCINRPTELSEIVQPLEFIARAVDKAVDDTGVAKLARTIDTLFLVNTFSLPHEGLLGALSEKIGAAPQKEAYTWIGASAPQWFVNRAAENIRMGETRLALICGGEALHSDKLEAEARGEKAQFDSYSLQGAMDGRRSARPGDGPGNEIRPDDADLHISALRKRVETP